MSEGIELTERQFIAGMVKIAIIIAMLVVIFGWVASLIADRFESIAVNSLLICFAFWMLSNGIVCILHIVDWYEARKAKTNG